MAVKKRIESKVSFPTKINSLDEFSASFGAMLKAIAADPEVAASVNQMTVGNPISTKAVPDVSDWVNDMIAGVQNAQAKWVRKVQQPFRSFKEGALAASKKYDTRTQAAIQEQRWQKRMGQVNEDEAIATAIADGGAALVAGVTKRQAKITRAITNLQPKVAALKRTLASMPSDTEAQADQKALAAIRGMRDIGKSNRGA